MKAFVTGVTGFVGGHIAKALVAQGHQVFGLLRNTAKEELVRSWSINPVVGAITDEALLHEHTTACDAVVHAAAGNSPEWGAMNTQIIHTFLKALEGSGKPIAMQGGTMVFGDTGANAITEQQLQYNPPPPLANQVALEEQFLAAKERGMRPLAIYGSYVYGGPGAVIPALMKNAAEVNGYSGYVGDGTNVWSSVHIEDWAHLFVLALESPDAVGQYLASTEIHSLQDIATVVHEVTPASKEVKSETPAWAQKHWNFVAQPLSFLNQAFDAKRAKEELHWVPKFRLSKQTV